VDNIDLDSMIEFLGELVGHPSQSGVDSPEPVLTLVSDWLGRHSIVHEWLRDDLQSPLGLAGEIQFGRPGPTYLLDATVDTAPYGDPTGWRYPPDRPSIVDGWLYGRGAADSKAGVAVFCHVLADFARRREQLAGRLCFVFDAEEHNGSFAGIRHYIAEHEDLKLDGVMIGYPGNDKLVAGGRGFLRARLVLHGRGAHSGSSRNLGVNAIARAGQLMERLAKKPIQEAEESFPLPPKITVTAISGGGSFALTPDRCELELDIRLTPEFNEVAARAMLEAELEDLDKQSQVTPSIVEWLPGWPAYQLKHTHPMVQALVQAAQDAFGHTVPVAVAGPSSIANYLATLDIPATAGLGVTYRAIHAADECVMLESLEPTFATYREALLRLFR
jgi:succinyl-diaminopimelate desuccinylase